MAKQIKDRILKMERVDWRKIKDLQPKNLKQMFNYAHIENSINKNGFAFPFGVWQDKNGDIYAIDGHTRIEVLSNMDNVPDLLPAFFIDAKNRQDAIKILLEVYNQRTNPIDEDVMREFLAVEEIDVEDIAIGSLNVFGLGGTFYDSDGNYKEGEVEAKDDDYEEPDNIKVDVVLGDLITFEKGWKELHRVLCGDSTDSDAVAKLMGEEKADMVFTDPPYEMDFEYSWVLPFVENSHIFIFNNDRAIVRQLSKSPFVFKKFFVFNHSGCAIPQEGGNECFLDHILLSHEVYGKPEVRFNKGNGLRTVIRGEYRRDTNHKHGKPIPLLASIINGYTTKKAIVVDIFAGGGSVFVACNETERICYGIDINTRNCQVIIDRMVKLDPDLVVKINGKVYK